VGQAVERLPSKHKALGAIPSTRETRNDIKGLTLVPSGCDVT
jgi:hypothetical protein